MKIVEYSGPDALAGVGQNHPWVPGASFISNPELLPLLRYVEALDVESAAELDTLVREPTPVCSEAAALWGCAENAAYSMDTRLRCALSALYLLHPEMAETPTS